MTRKLSALGFALATMLGFGAWYFSVNGNQSIQVQPAVHDIQEAPLADVPSTDAPVSPYAGECIHNDPNLGAKRFADVRLEDHNLATNTYSFVVTNLHAVPIIGVSVGRSSEHRYLAVSSRYPKEIVSPSGWMGVAGAGDESAYLVYTWISEGGKSILEGETLSGFRLQMPKDFPSSESQYHDLVDADNQPVLPLSLEAVPYTVLFNDGTCYWGSTDPRP